MEEDEDDYKFLEKIFTFDNALVLVYLFGIGLVVYLIALSFTIPHIVLIGSLVMGVSVVAGVLVSLDIHPMNSVITENTLERNK